MNLETTYLKLPLRSPLVVSASPLSVSIENIKRMEEAGAGAIVLFSLFEEQYRLEQQRSQYLKLNPKATAANALALFPSQEHFLLGPDTYLDHIQKCKKAVSIPIIASLNCESPGSWTDFAPKIEAAGADALELNIHYFPTNVDRTAEHIEDMYVQILRVIKGKINIPVAIKLTPFFTNVAHVASRLDHVGADALVLFNRFYQPDFDPRTLKVVHDVPFGHPQDSRLTLHWIAMLYGSVRADLAATGGIYTTEDVVKMLIVGAKVVMLASVLLEKGIDHLRTLDHSLRKWLRQNDYASAAGLQGIVRQFHSKDAGAFERAAYIRAITSGEAAT